MFKKNLKKYYNITRNRVDYLSFQGKILLKKEKFKEAIIILRDAISLILTKRHYNYNIVAELYRDLAVAYSKLNSDRYGLKMNLCSIKYYEGSKNKDKRDLKNYINALLSAINIYFKYNKYEKAKNHINKILKYDKNNFKAIYFLAVIYYKESDFKNAEKFIIKALRLCKNTEIKLELYYWLVRIYLISEQTSRAYRYLLKGTKISYSFYLKYSWPNNTFSNYTKNKYLLFLSKKLQKSKSIKLYNVIIYLSIELKLKKSTKNMVKKFREEFPEEKDTYYWEIILKLQNRDLKNARKLYKDISQKWPNFIAQYDWKEISYGIDKVRKILV